jgi:hypothetical protein
LRRRYPEPVSPELQAAIDLQNKANRIAEVKSRKPRLVLRAEANKVRRELKHDAGMTTVQRSRFERLRQAQLIVDRARIATAKRIGDLLNGLQDKERKTELGIVLPSGKQIGDILAGVSARRD